MLLAYLAFKMLFPQLMSLLFWERLTSINKTLTCPVAIKLSSFAFFPHVKCSESLCQSVPAVGLEGGRKSSFSFLESGPSSPFETLFFFLAFLTHTRTHTTHKRKDKLCFFFFNSRT